MKVYESQKQWNEQNSTEGSVQTKRSFPSLDRVLLEGYLVEKPNLQQTKTGKHVANYSLISRHTNDEVSFFPVETWENQAKSDATILAKGSRVIVEGRLKQDRWSTPNGEKRSRIKIVANQVVYLPKKSIEQENKSLEEATH